VLDGKSGCLPRRDTSREAFHFEAGSASFSAPLLAALHWKLSQ
jgi:hypothetical protein